MPSASRIVTLTTDFGTDDTFVGEVKGAVLAVCPWASIVDLTHAVPAHDIEAGSFLLACGSDSFPDGTVHVAVVDPGVGTGRRALAVRTERGLYLAPDNGLLTRVLRRDAVHAIHALTSAQHRRRRVSGTFEGRDVFAPAAGWILRGEPLDHLGPRITDPVLLDLPPSPETLETPTTIVAVAWVDRFGNAILDLRGDPMVRAVAEREQVSFAAHGGTAHGLYPSYDAGPLDEPFAVVNGSGHVELACRRGRAAEVLGVSPGSLVEVRLAPAPGRDVV